SRLDREGRGVGTEDPGRAGDRPRRTDFTVRIAERPGEAGFAQGRDRRRRVGGAADPGRVVERGGDRRRTEGDAGHLFFVRLEDVHLIATRAEPARARRAADQESGRDTAGEPGGLEFGGFGRVLEEDR